MERLVVQLFGAPRISFDGAPWRIAVPPRCMQLLAYLALRTEPVPRAAVAAALWPDELDSTARSNLRRHLHLLRHGLPDLAGIEWLRDENRTVGWNAASPATIDVAEFVRLIDDPATRRAALDLVEGDLLAHLDDEWLVIERERLRSRYLEGLLDEAIAQRRARDFPLAIAYAERLLAADDLREDAVREIVTARYESGDRGSALATYERFAARLHTMLGVEPAPETQAVAAALRAGTPLFSDEPLERVGPGGWQPAFAGREAELATLRAAWMRAARGTGTTIFAGGEAGIGKSRLVGELAEIARTAGGRVVSATTSAPEAEPYQPVFGALRRLLPFAAGLARDDRRFSALARALPELRTIVDIPGDDAARTESLARERLFDGIAAFIEHVAATKPLLMIFEDLHGSREATLDALGMLARRVGSLPVLIVVTYRSDETAPNHPLRELRARLTAERRASSLALRRLDAAAVGAMFDAGDLCEIPAGIAADIHRISDGNPLFATQLARTYDETGAIPEDSATSAIGAAIAERLARIEPHVRAVGELAAVAGETFDIDLLSAAGGWDEADVIDALGRLMDAAIVRETAAAGHGYTFTHALIAEALYESTPAGARIARHRRIAHLLERNATADRATVETVARHWRASGDAARAATAYVRSAVAALDVFARADAVALARTAYGLAEDDAGRFAALRIAAAAPARSDEREGWEADLEQLSAVAGRLGESERFEALALREAYFWQCGRPAESMDAIEAMTAIAAHSGDGRQIAIAGERRSRADLSAGRLRDALANGLAALAAALALDDAPIVNRLRALVSSIALRVGELDLSATQLRAQREALAGGGTLVERMDIARAESMLAVSSLDGELAERAGSELLELARLAADRENESNAHTMLAYAAHERFDARAVREHYAVARVLYEQLGRAQMLVNTVVNSSIFEADIGNHALALAAWSGVLPQMEALSMRTSIGYIHVHRSQIAAIDGNVSLAIESAHTALEFGELTADRRLRAESLLALGAARSMAGDETSIALLHEACGELSACGAGRLVPEALAQSIEALLALGRAGDACEPAAQLRTIVARTEHAERYPGRIALALVREAEARGDAAAAGAARAHGTRLVEERIARLGDDGASYAALPFNRSLLLAAAVPR